MRREEKSILYWMLYKLDKQKMWDVGDKKEKGKEEEWICTARFTKVPPFRQTMKKNEKKQTRYIKTQWVRESLKAKRLHEGRDRRQDVLLVLVLVRMIQQDRRQLDRGVEGGGILLVLLVDVVAAIELGCGVAQGDRGHGHGHGRCLGCKEGRRRRLGLVIGHDHRDRRGVGRGWRGGFLVVLLAVLLAMVTLEHGVRRLSR